MYVLITTNFKRQELVLILSHYGNQITEKYQSTKSNVIRKINYN